MGKERDQRGREIQEMQEMRAKEACVISLPSIDFLISRKELGLLPFLIASHPMLLRDRVHRLKEFAIHSSTNKVVTNPRKSATKNISEPPIGIRTIVLLQYSTYVLIRQGIPP